MNSVLILKNGWFLQYQGKKLAATVPGDIALDLYNNGKIKNPYYGINHRDLHFIRESDFTYENEFLVDEDLFSAEELLL